MLQFVLTPEQKDYRLCNQLTAKLADRTCRYDIVSMSKTMPKW